MKYLGYPLIGDYLYNPDMEQIQRQALHAWKLSFVHPITGEKMQFTAPLPEDMAAVLLPVVFQRFFPDQAFTVLFQVS